MIIEQYLITNKFDVLITRNFFEKWEIFTCVRSSLKLINKLIKKPGAIESSVYPLIKLVKSGVCELFIIDERGKRPRNLYSQLNAVQTRLVAVRSSRNIFLR